jgi:hypothetical protein
MAARDKGADREDWRLSAVRVVASAAGTVVLTVLGLLPVELAVAALGLGASPGLGGLVGGLLGRLAKKR